LEKKDTVKSLLNVVF